MGLTYDITQDYLYREGLEKGQKAKEREVVIKMLQDKTLSIEKIAEFADVTVDYVKRIKKELSK